MAYGRAWLIAMMACVVIASAGCSGSGSGPLRTLSAPGQSQPLINGGAIPVLPDQVADFTVTVANPSKAAIQLVSAMVIPAPGYPAARLAHIGVVTGPGVVVAGRDWPDGVQVEPFAGASLSGENNNIMIGVTGGKTNRNYAVAGLRIRYRAGGNNYEVIAWGVGVACVRNKVGPKYPDCNAALNNAISAVAKMAHP